MWTPQAEPQAEAQAALAQLFLHKNLHNKQTSHPGKAELKDALCKNAETISLLMPLSAATRVAIIKLALYF